MCVCVCVGIWSLLIFWQKCPILAWGAGLIYSGYFRSSKAHVEGYWCWGTKSVVFWFVLRNFPWIIKKLTAEFAEGTQNYVTSSQRCSSGSLWNAVINVKELDKKKLTRHRNNKVKFNDIQPFAKQKSICIVIRSVNSISDSSANFTQHQNFH